MSCCIQILFQITKICSTRIDYFIIKLLLLLHIFSHRFTYFLVDIFSWSIWLIIININFFGECSPHFFFMLYLWICHCTSMWLNSGSHIIIVKLIIWTTFQNFLQYFSMHFGIFINGRNFRCYNRMKFACSGIVILDLCIGFSV